MSYTITGEGFEAQTKSDKSKAITLATELAKEHKTTVEVATKTGTVVHVAKARKAQKSTPRFTRVDTHELIMGEGVKLPKGFDVAYARVRANHILLRKLVSTPEGVIVDYRVFDCNTGNSVDVDSTRAAGAMFRMIRKGELELVA